MSVAPAGYTSDILQPPQAQPQQPQQPQQGPLGFNLHDPMHLALLLSPLAEVLRHGAGAAIYHAALGGLQYRQQAQQHQQEFQQNLDLRNRQLTDAEEERRARATDRTTGLGDRKAALTRQYWDELRAHPENYDQLNELYGRQFPGEPLPRPAATPKDTEPIIQTPSGPMKISDASKVYGPEGVRQLQGIHPLAPAEKPETPVAFHTRRMKELEQEIDPARIVRLAKEQGVDPQPYLNAAKLKASQGQANLAHTQSLTAREGQLTAQAGQSKAAEPKLSTQERAALNEYQRIETKQDALRKQGAGALLDQNQQQKLYGQADALDTRLGAILTQFPNLRPIVGAPAPQDFSVQRGMTQQGLPQGRPAPAGARSAAPVPTQRIPDTALPQIVSAYKQTKVPLSTAEWGQLAPRQQAALTRQGVQHR